MDSGAKRARDSDGRCRLAVVLVFCVILGGVYCVPMRFGVVCGESMSPTLHHGQVFLMRRFRRGAQFGRGDVVVLEVNGQQHIKRVYALAGETVSGLDWQETDGHPDYIATDKEMDVLPELARRRPAVGAFVRMTVPRGHVFVLGDAITRSYDSRHFGPVPVEKVTGRLVASLFSVQRGDSAYTTALAREIESRPRACDPLD